MQRRGVNEDLQGTELTVKLSLADVLSSTAIRLLEMLVLVEEPKFYSLSEAAVELGVSVSSVSRVVNKLLRSGFLIVDERPLSNTGRPNKMIKLDYSKKTVRAVSDLIRSYRVS